MANWRILIIVYVAIVADSIASNVLNPFAPEWMTEGLGMDKEWEGMYAGLMVGLFPFAVGVSSPLLGWLSDTYGRKPLLVFGLAMSTAFTMLMYLTSFFWLACVARTLAGLTDATQSVAYAAIGDVSKGADRIMAFAYASAAFQVARMLSAVIGGYLAGVSFSLTPEPQHYLVPALVGSGLCAVAAVLVALLMGETIPSKYRGIPVANPANVTPLLPSKVGRSSPAPITTAVAVQPVLGHRGTSLPYWHRGFPSPPLRGRHQGQAEPEDAMRHFSYGASWDGVLDMAWVADEGRRPTDSESESASEHACDDGTAVLTVTVVETAASPAHSHPSAGEDVSVPADGSHHTSLALTPPPHSPSASSDASASPSRSPHSRGHWAEQARWLRSQSRTGSASGSASGSGDVGALVHALSPSTSPSTAHTHAHAHAHAHVAAAGPAGTAPARDREVSSGPETETARAASESADVTRTGGCGAVARTHAAAADGSSSGRAERTAYAAATDGRWVWELEDEKSGREAEASATATATATAAATSDREAEAEAESGETTALLPSLRDKRADLAAPLLRAPAPAPAPAPEPPGPTSALASAAETRTQRRNDHAERAQQAQQQAAPVLSWGEGMRMVWQDKLMMRVIVACQSLSAYRDMI